MPHLQGLVSSIVSILSSIKKRPDAIQEAMKLMLDYSDVCRVYYFELQPSDEHGYLANHLFEVCAPGVEPQIDNHELQNVPMIPYFESWINAFSENKPYFGDVSTLPEPEQEVLASQGIKSILVLPVFSEAELAGFIGFDDTRRERNWTDENAELLSQAAAILGRMLAAHMVDITSQRQEQHFRMLVDMMPMASIQCATDRHIVSWNSTATSVFGYSEDEALGMNLEDMLVRNKFSNLFTGNQIEPADEPNGQQVDAETARLTAEAEPSSPPDVANDLGFTLVNICEARRKDGRIIPVRWRIRVVKNRLDQVTSYLILAEDISDELRQNQQLKESEELFRNLYERMTDGVVYQEENGKIIRANTAASTLLGLSMDQLLGRESFDPRWKAIREDGSDFPGDEHPAIVALRTGKVVQNVNMGVYNPQDASYRWLNINAIPEFHPDRDKPFRVFTLFRDVTESLLLNKQLTVQYEKFLAYAESLTIGVWLRNEKFELTFVNKALASLFAITQEEFFENDGEKYLDFVHPEDRHRVKNEHARHHRDKVDLELEWRLIRRDGEQRWVHVRLVYIETPGSEMPTSAGSMTDITELKVKMETLQAARKEAESLSKLRMGIIEAISHEFRTPVTSIMGFARLIQENGGDSDTVDYADMIVQSTNRLYETLESILNYSNMISQNLTVRPREMELEDSLRSILENYNIKCADKGLYFQSFVPKNTLVHTDESILNSIVEKLLDNAVKFTHEGGVRLNIRTIGTKLLIEVNDTGIGIPEDMNLAVFEPFRQGSEGDARLYEGSGMGLPVVVKQTELLGGKLHHENNEFGGCRFVVEIPLEQAPVALVPETESPVISEDDLKILYLEDNPVLQLMMKKSLPEFQFTMERSPQKVINKLEMELHHVYLLDINLNNPLTGIDVCQAIRQQPDGDKPFIVAVTAKSKDYLEEHIGPHGFNAYVAKPFNHRTLKRLIASAYSLPETDS